MKKFPQKQKRSSDLNLDVIFTEYSYVTRGIWLFVIFQLIMLFLLF